MEEARGRVKFRFVKNVAGSLLLETFSIGKFVKRIFPSER